MDLQSYLTRIRFSGPARADLATLRELYRLHLRWVPFENLDILRGRRLRLRRDALFAKVVGQGRGGLCYELNGLFEWLLRAVGFRTRLVSARVVIRGRPGPDFDHMALVVACEEGEWLADVGFGALLRQPIRLCDGEVQSSTGARVRLTRRGGWWTLWEQKGRGWVPRYRFSEDRQPLRAFEAMCRFHQTSPRSPFTRGRICVRTSPTGRVSLSDQTLVVTRGRVSTRRLLRNERAVQAALQRHFGIRDQSSGSTTSRS
jgi:N-hydroxyarylamine O-acetyltransferase